MKNTMITENAVQKMLMTVLNEEISKVKREEFNRVQFKIEELQNSLNETIKELRKLQDSVPNGLKTITNSRIDTLSRNLNESQKIIVQLKDKIRKYKRHNFSATTEEKKK